MRSVTIYRKNKREKRENLNPVSTTTGYALNPTLKTHPLSINAFLKTAPNMSIHATSVCSAYWRRMADQIKSDLVVGEIRIYVNDLEDVFPFFNHQHPAKNDILCFQGIEGVETFPKNLLLPKFEFSLKRYGYLNFWVMGA